MDTQTIDQRIGELSKLRNNEKKTMDMFFLEAEKELDKINTTNIGIKTYSGENISSTYGEWDSTERTEVDPEAVYMVREYTHNNKEIRVWPQIELKKEKKYFGLLTDEKRVLKGYELLNLEAVAPIEFEDTMKSKRDLKQFLKIKGKVETERAIYNWYILDTYYNRFKDNTIPVLKEIANRLKR